MLKVLQRSRSSSSSRCRNAQKCGNGRRLKHHERPTALNVWATAAWPANRTQKTNGMNTEARGGTGEVNTTHERHDTLTEAQHMRLKKRLTQRLTRACLLFLTTNTRGRQEGSRRRTRDRHPRSTISEKRAACVPDANKKIVHLSPLPVKSSALQRIVTFPGAGIEIVSRQSPTFQSGPSFPQLLLTTCVNAKHTKFVRWTSTAVGADGVHPFTSHNPINAA